MDMYRNSPESTYSDCQVFTELVFLGGDISCIKDEPADEEADELPLAITHDENSSCTLDPMNLLDLQDESEMNAESDSNEAFSSGTNPSEPSETQWSQWMRDLPWLLHEKSYGMFGYCLYCDISICVRKCYTLLKHERGKEHAERKENYEAFRKHMEQLALNLPMGAIKQEYECNNTVAEIRRKRQSEKEQLINFNWDRWMRAHDWLERLGTDGYTGFCKWCEQTLNVEFKYFRQRHEESEKHKTSCRLKSDKGSTEKRQSITDESVRSDTFPFFEKSPDCENEGRCVVCNVRLNISSLRKHSKTKFHCSNLRRNNSSNSVQSTVPFDDSTVPVKLENLQHPNWDAYHVTHPWLVGDPTDLSYGYCLYCRKRLMYGTSSIRRKQHEDSIAHNLAKEEYKKVQIITDDDSSSSESNNEKNEPCNLANKNNMDIEQDNSNDNEGSTSKTKTSIRLKRGSTAWVNSIPWLRSVSNSRNYVQCIYCNVKLLLPHFSRLKHERTARHIAAAKQFKRNKSKNQSSTLKYEWSVCCPQTNVVSCKYCNVSLGMKPNHHNHDMSNIHRQNKLIYLQKLNDKGTSNKTRAADTIGSPKGKDGLSMSERISQWKFKWPWAVFNLKPDPLYIFCKHCKTFIFANRMSAFYKHEKTMKHKFNEKQKDKRIEETALMAETEGNADVEEDVDVERLNEETDTPWLIMDDNCKSYGYCKYCRLYIRIDGTCKETHEKSEKHRSAEEAFNQDEGVGKENPEINFNDYMQIDDEDDDESMEENASIDTKNNLEIEASQPQDISASSSKNGKLNMKKDLSSVKNLISSHMELLRLFCNISDKNEQSLNPEILASEKILTSSLSLATLLANMMQQNNPNKQSSLNDFNASTNNERNTFDLFFESMSESVKKLPPDLAAEGKIKVGKIVYDLELRALKRKYKIPDNNSPQNPFESPSTTTNNGDTE